MALDSVVQHAQDPIIIMTLSGSLRPEDVEEGQRLAYDIEAAMPAHNLLIVIVDTLQSTASFADTIKILRGDAQATGEPSPSDNEFHLLIVGSNAMIRLYVDSRRQKQFGGGDVPMFHTVDDALAAAHTLIAQKRSARIDADAETQVVTPAP